jgi:hypothetical protein
LVGRKRGCHPQLPDQSGANNSYASGRAGAPPFVGGNAQIAVREFDSTGLGEPERLSFVLMNVYLLVENDLRASGRLVRLSFPGHSMPMAASATITHEDQR